MSASHAKGYWISLCCFSAASAGAALFLFQTKQQLPDLISQYESRPARPKPVPALDLSNVRDASKLIEAPALWKTVYPTVLFASEHYLLEEGQPKRPKDGSIHYHSKTRQPIPNSWFLAHKLALFSSRVPLEDTDGDGFTNEEEWLAGTDPTDPKAHPPLLSKLQYLRQDVVNNRIRFLQHLGGSTKPANVRVTVRLEDVPGTPQYELKLGDSIPGTGLVVTGFEPRRKPDPSGTFNSDASLLFIIEKASGRVEKAEVREVANFTDRTLHFRLFYPLADREFSVKPGEKIPLSETEIYDLLDASAASAHLRSQSGLETDITSSSQ